MPRRPRFETFTGRMNMLYSRNTRTGKVSTMGGLNEAGPNKGLFTIATRYVKKGSGPRVQTPVVTFKRK